MAWPMMHKREEKSNMSAPSHPSVSTDPSLSNGEGCVGGGDGGGGEISFNTLFERRKKTGLLNSNGSTDLEDDDVEECSKRTRVKDKGRFALPSLASRVSGVFQVGKRLWQSPNRRAEMIQIIKSHRRIVLLILVAIPFILRPSRLWKWRYHLFGRHNIHGGAYGRRFENLVNKWTWQETQRQQRMQLQQLGIRLPWQKQDKGKFTPHLIQTQAAIRELLVRRHARGNTLVALEKSANAAAMAAISCHLPTTNRQEGNSAGENGDDCHRISMIPKVLFVPDLISWNPPRPGKVKSFQKLLFDEDEMKLLVADTTTAPFPRLVDKWDAAASGSMLSLDQIQLFALCAVYHFGGVFVGEHDGLAAMQEEQEDNKSLVTDMLDSSTGGWFEETTLSSTTSTTTTKKSHNTMNHHHRGGGSFGVVVLSGNSTVNTIAATPRHPLLYCALSAIDQHSMSTSIPISSLLSSAIQKMPVTGWTRLWGTCQPQNKNSAAVDCCTNISYESFTSSLHASDLLSAESKGPAVAELWVQHSPSNKITAQSKPTRPVTVSIQQNLSARQQQQQGKGGGGGSDGKATSKISLDSRLQSLGLQPNWFCARCIRIPTYGTMEKCSRFCPSKEYTEFICHAPDVPEVVHVPLNIIVQGGGSGGGSLVSRSSSSLRSTIGDNRAMIPRIIHQTWFEDTDIDRYPQLARLQKGWKNTGWQYRLYTDITARKYIEDYFPARFVEAFDVLIPGAYKVREGGTMLRCL
jgi:hypothetical protein